MKCILCAALFLSLWYVCAAHAAIYYVSGGGHGDTPNNNNNCSTAQTITTPKATIVSGGQCLINPGDVLYIRGGNYNELVDKNTIGTLGGTSWATAIMIAAYPGETVTIGPDGNGDHVLGALGEYVIWDRLIIDGSNSLYAASFGAPGHNRFQNGEFKNAHGALNCGAGNCGPNVTTNGVGHEFVNCKSYGSYWSYGFYLIGDGHLIDNCEIYNNNWYGIQMYSPDGSDNHIVRNNRIHDNGFDAHGQGRRQSGIVVEHSGSFGGRDHIYNNLIYNNAEGGIEVGTSSSNLEIYNNTIYGNQGSYAGVQVYGSGTIIRNNILYNNNSGPIAGSGSGTVQDHNLTTNPTFVNAGAGDFHLQASSNAINQGATLSAVPADKDGVTRPQGPAYDIGAYEFVGGVPLTAPHNFRLQPPAP